MSFINKFNFTLKYFKYILTSKTKYGIHSPFVFSFVVDILDKKVKQDEFIKIEEIRKKLLKSNETINTEDFGTGGSIEKTNIKKIKKIARNSAKSKKYGKLLFKIVQFYKPNNILELGTSLGISTLYQSLGNKSAKFISIEGCENIAKQAQIIMNEFGANADIFIGNFDEVLPEIINKFNNLDYVFFDGNHRKEPTIRYFNQCLDKINNDSIFIFDDIHWSKEMEDAWETIKNNEHVTVSIDLFFIGIIFFRKEQIKQHFVIRH